MKRGVHKRGQITLFILLGVVILITLFVLFYIQTIASDLEGTTINVNSGQQDLVGPKEYIEGCVSQEVVQVSKSISTLFKSQPSFLYDNNSYTFLFSQTSGVNPIGFLQVENYIDEVLPNQLAKCIDTSIYEDQGVSVTRGTIKTKTSLAFDSVGVVLDFPLTLQGDDISFDISSTKVTVPLPLGRLIQSVNTMLNEETANGWFDQQAYVHQSSNAYLDEPLITITKQKPYPHTLYNFTLHQLADQIELYVGIQGARTSFARSSDFSYEFAPIVPETCCEFDAMCVEGTTREVCLLKGGFFTESCENCATRVQESTIVESAEFSSCSGIESGTSWCEYHPGVGGRFYRNNCVNGEVQVESCRDFREEVCVEENDVALCRPNTAQSCFACTDESCCSQYDCSYVGDGICVPESPLGFEFWDGTQQYCQALYTRVSAQSDVTSFTAREREFLCSLLSDCGKTFNFYGDFSQETIDGDKLKDVLTDTGILSYSVAQNPITRFDLPNNSITPSQQVAETLVHLQEFLEVSQDSFLDPTNDFQFENTVSQLCQPFYPAQSTCEVCGKNRPCSEYACKSLGTDCEYLLIEGTHQCVSQAPIAEDFSVTSLVAKDHGVARASIGTASGYVVAEEHTVLKPLQVTFNTSKPALCKPSYLPGLSFGELSSSDLTNGEYKEQHVFTIRFINNLPVFGSLTEYFGAKDFTALVSQIVDFSFQVEKLQRKYPFIDRYQLPFANALNQFVKVTTDLELDAVVKQLLEDAQSGKYALFFTCVDQSGAQMEESTFVQFRLKQTCDEPLEFEVKADAHPFVDSQIQLTTQILSECRFDVVEKSFDELTYEFECPKTIFEVSNEGYQCAGDVSSLLGNQTNLRLYTQCREIMNPPLQSQIEINVIGRNQSNVSGVSQAFARGSNSLANANRFIIDLEETELEFVYNLSFYSDLQLSSTIPMSCTSAQNLTMACSVDSCTVAREQFLLTNVSELIFSCETLPESLSCPNTYTLPRISQIVPIELTKVTPYVVDELVISGSQISFTTFSDFARDISCSYRVEQEPAQTISLVNQIDTNSQFEITFTESISGLVGITCVDEFGVEVQKSGFIS